jgi:hypothetical protein
LSRAVRELKDEELETEFNQTISQTKIDSYALDDLFSLIDAHNLHFILLLDEFENVTKNANFDIDFFYGLRAMAIHHNLALIAASRRELIDLCHSDAVRASPFFNIFANIHLSAFNGRDANALVEQSLAGTDVQFSPAELELLSNAAGSHPYFLQIAAHFLFAAHCEHKTAQEREQYLLQEFREEATPCLADYWHHSNDGERIVLSALALLSKQGKAGKKRFSLGKLKDLYQRSELTLSLLEKRALIAAGEKGYTLFSSVFGDWIIAELTDVMDDTQTYEEWLDDNRSMVQKASRSARDEIGEILPQIKAGYRQFIVEWLSDPQTLVSAATLLRSAFG